MPSKELTLYMRSGCHLCEDMLADLRAMAGPLALSINQIDIDTDPELQMQYNTEIPLLEYQGKRLCHYYLDPIAVREVLING